LNLEPIASFLCLKHPLFDAEDDLEACYLSVDDEEGMIFTYKEENNWIYFFDKEDFELFKKGKIIGLFRADMYPGLGRKKYSWTALGVDKKIVAFHKDLKVNLKNWVKDTGHYIRGSAPIIMEENSIIIEKVKAIKSKSEFNKQLIYYIPVKAKNFPVTHSAEASKFVFFWELSQGEFLVNIGDCNAPIIFGRLKEKEGIYPGKIIGMLFPSENFAWLD